MNTSQFSQQELKRRILLDFNKTFDDVVEEIRSIMPDVTYQQIESWEKSNALESIVIDGKKRYFRRASRNIFRIDRDAKNYYIDVFGDEKAWRKELFAGYLPTIVNEQLSKRFCFRFRLTVEPNVVPNGETIRCWLPYPKECKYQHILEVKASKESVVSEHNRHSSIFLEKKAIDNTPVVFEVEYEIETKSFFYKKHKYDIDNIEHISLSEQPPHIVFSEQIKHLSKQIVGEERDKETIARLIFRWISENIFWAVAREYSTIENIPNKVIDHRHGDCGEVTLLFMTLCRYNGIPAEWLSGFMLHPKAENLHDWCQIYISPWGWIPVDVSFGIQHWATDQEITDFFFGGMDAYRMIVNSGISDSLTPAKIFERSETVDFQRGEVEWRGGNIYFDQFDYHFEVEEITK